MDAEKQKRRKQIIIIVLAFAVALPSLIYFQFIRPNLGGGGTQPEPGKPAVQAGEKGETVATGTAQLGVIPPSTPGGAAATGQAATASFPSGGGEPLLAYRDDPFGLGAAVSPTTGIPEGRGAYASAPLLAMAAAGIVERGSEPRGRAAGAWGARTPPLTPVKFYELNVTPRPTPPLPDVSPRLGYQPASLPLDVGTMLRTGAGTPPIPYPTMEGMRLSGIVRTGQPRAILEWRTPEGTLRSLVVSPNQPLVYPEGGSVVRLGYDYAIIKDARDKTWRVPLR